MKGGKYGRHAYCKMCKTALDRSRYDQEKTREWHKRRRQDNPGIDYETTRKWKQENPDKVAASKQRRRTRKAGNGGSYTGDEWKILVKSMGSCCLSCGEAGTWRTLTVDHVVPISEGGTNNIGNIQPLCGACNSSKGTKKTDYRPAT